MQPPTLPDAKSALRRVMIEKRRSIAHDPDAAMKLRDQFLASVALPPHAVVAGYVARGGEIDPTPLITALREHSHTIALPVMQGRDLPLLFRAYNSGDVLQPNNFGIPEPRPDAPIIMPDIILVPLVAFDKALHRLGMGGGYYDRTLATLRGQKKIQAIGLAFAWQEVSQIPSEPHDARLDGMAAV
jgi:5-formyltetrahydrofolate cyclo-ligase